MEAYIKSHRSAWESNLPRCLLDKHLRWRNADRRQREIPRIREQESPQNRICRAAPSSGSRQPRCRWSVDPKSSGAGRSTRIPRFSRIPAKLSNCSLALASIAPGMGPKLPNGNPCCGQSFCTAGSGAWIMVPLARPTMTCFKGSHSFHELTTVFLQSFVKLSSCYRQKIATKVLRFFRDGARKKWPQRGSNGAV